MISRAVPGETVTDISLRMRMIHHDSAHGRWELARCRPHTALTPYVVEYEGYSETAGKPVRRREMPNGNVVLIINFGQGWLIGDERAPDRLDRFSSFAGGVYDRYAISESTGSAHCLQVNFTPLGARLFFDMPMSEMTLRVVHFEDVFGAEGRTLAERLFEAGGWPHRFATLEAEIARRVLRAQPRHDLPAWVWERIVATSGSVSISALAKELEISRKHLSVSFREMVGLAPKTYAQVCRFQVAARRIALRPEPAWSEIALDCGYFDQAHFNRDFRRFSGYTPGEYRLRALADGTGVLDA